MRLGVFALLLPFLAGAGPALANCYEILGCDDSSYFSTEDLRQLSCPGLYDLRNTIYKQHGYCFGSQRAIDEFGNEGCFVQSPGEIALNDFEAANVLAIKSVEKQLNCI